MQNSSLAPTQRGIFLMIAAIVCFTIMDALGKSLSTDLGVVQTVWARYLGQLAIVLMLFRGRLTQVMQTNFPVLQWTRAGFQLGAFVIFFEALRHLGLAEATAVFEVAPILITLGAAFFLGERFGLQRSIGVVIGLVGMLIIVRPGADAFSPYAILPVGAAACFAGYALISRKIGPHETVWTSLAYSGVLGTIAMTIAVPFQWVTPTFFQIIGLCAVSLTGALAQYLLVRAFAQTEASILAPFSYVSLVASSLWGVLFFGEWPDVYVIIGAMLIAGSGIFIWYRETRS